MKGSMQTLRELINKTNLNRITLCVLNDDVEFYVAGYDEVSQVDEELLDRFVKIGDSSRKSGAGKPIIEVELLKNRKD